MRPRVFRAPLVLLPACHTLSNPPSTLLAGSTKFTLVTLLFLEISKPIRASSFFCPGCSRPELGFPSPAYKCVSLNKQSPNSHWRAALPSPALSYLISTALTAPDRCPTHICYICSWSHLNGTSCPEGWWVLCFVLSTSEVVNTKPTPAE